VSDEEKFMSVPEAARILGVSQDLVRALFDAGVLTGMRTRPEPGGHRRPSRASVEAYRRAQRGEEPGERSPGEV
jgi:excisionase family DNA binding protein